VIDGAGRIDDPLGCPGDTVGSGWKLVRRTNGNMHSATDDLKGTQVYGSPVSPIAAESFSVNFEEAAPNWNQILLATGDCKYWMIMTKDAAIGDDGNAWYSGTQRAVVKSSSYSDPYTIQAFRRENKNEDPWLQPGKSHSQAEALYVEGSASPNRGNGRGKNHNGLNVYVRVPSGGVWTDVSTGSCRCDESLRASWKTGNLDFCKAACADANCVQMDFLRTHSHCNLYMSTCTVDQGCGQGWEAYTFTASPGTPTTPCAADQHVSSDECVACSAGMTNAEGDTAPGDDTSCDITYCSANEHVRNNACVPCPAGTSNTAGHHDASGTDTTCDITECAANQRVSSHSCVPCPLGTTKLVGDDASGEDTTCDITECAVNQRVSNNACVECSAGKTNAAGNDDASGLDTTCDITNCAANQHVTSNLCVDCLAGTFTDLPGHPASGGDTACTHKLCGPNQHVVDHTCVDCLAGKTNAEGDDASGGGTLCDATVCETDRHVSSHSCVACSAGTTNLVGDIASGDDTSCDITYCSANQRVSNNTCVPCPAGTTNEAGHHDASGTDTTCDITECAANQRVINNVCVPCPSGTTNTAGKDDASGDNTACVITLCAANEYVSNNACAQCPAGSTNAEGDDASGENTLCDKTYCSGQQRVSNHACVGCSDGKSNSAGNQDATGADTTCANFHHYNDWKVTSTEYEGKRVACLATIASSKTKTDACNDVSVQETCESSYQEVDRGQYSLFSEIAFCAWKKDGIECGHAVGQVDGVEGQDVGCDESKRCAMDGSEHHVCPQGNQSPPGAPAFVKVIESAR